MFIYSNTYTIASFQQFFVRFIVCLLLLTHGTFSDAQTNTTLDAGAYIVDMGIQPQTMENAIIPYGMVYDLLNNYGVSIEWVINGTKAKDGTDFTYNGYDYKGGPFIIRAEYLSATVLDRIQNYWEPNGVVGTITTSPITVPVFTTIKDMPVWTLDAKNGGIAQGYLENALIPPTQYNYKDPQDLNCCDDLFAMPHADPEWETHSNIYDWNLDCNGEIWMACHAGSAFLNMFNYDVSGDPDEQTNFLVSKTGTAMGSGPWADPANAAVLWGDHDSGTPPYTYNYPSNPAMQFMGTIDGATQNGSEQIYLPVNGTSWNPGSVMVYDPDHPDVLEGNSPGPAAVVVYDNGFGDPNRGKVMLEAGHSHNKSSGPESVAAQRIFFNFSFFSNNEDAIIPDLSGIPSEVLGGNPTSLSFTLPPGEDINDYTMTWSSSCGGSFSPIDAQTTTYTPPSVSSSTPCFIYVTITDMCGKETSENKLIVVNCELGLSLSVSNPTCNGFLNGIIISSAATGIPPYTWDWVRQEGGSSSGTGTLIAPLYAGTYDITITDNNGTGCPETVSVTLSEPPLLVATNAVTDAICNGDPSGSINLTVSGGTPSYSFDWGGGITTEDRSNINGGTYTVTVTDDNACTATSTAVVGSPPVIDITLSETPVNCSGGNDGAISNAVTGGAGGFTFAWNDGSSNQNRSGLLAATYTVTVTDQDNCTNSASINVTEPALALSVTSINTDISCIGGNDGAIDLSVSGGTPNYSYSWGHGPTVEDLISLSGGTYNVTVTDMNSCTESLSNVINQPASLALSMLISNATCPADTDGNIDLTVSGGTPIYTYDWDNNGPQMPDSDPEDLSGIGVGIYTVTVTDANGCTAAISAEVDADNALPTEPSTINH